MKAASLSEIKNELVHLHPEQLKELCLRLARYKKENKELLSYLLFEAHNEEAYRENVKQMVDEEFKTINTKNLYLAKKSLRKILRISNKYIKYSGNKETEAELILYFCRQLKTSGIPFNKHKILNNLFQQQLKKLNAAIDSLHEDLQYDLRRKAEDLLE